MTDRRYTEDEVREIFEAAAQEPAGGGTALSRSEGMTLEELKGIGAEVGLSPDRIQDAALALDQQPAVFPQKKLLGMPLSVHRTVPLPRAMTDREWEMLVAELRRTFHAKGTVTQTGSLRGWTNSNLHAYVEPTESGYQLRLGTMKGNALPMARAGIGAFAMALVLFVALGIEGTMADKFLGPLMFALMGTAAMGGTLIGLPGWAKEREGQMDYIAARALAIVRAGDAQGEALPPAQPGPDSDLDPDADASAMPDSDFNSQD
jgi:hypothetical protein